MEIKGYIKEILEARGGVSARTGNSWKIQSYVLETVEQFPRHVVFDVKNDNIAAFGIQQGEEMTVYFDIDAQEYQGRWYNRITAWKVEKTGACLTVIRTPANGQRTTDNGQRTAGGQRTTDNGQRTTDNGQRTDGGQPMQNLQHTFGTVEQHDDKLPF